MGPLSAPDVDLILRDLRLARQEWQAAVMAENHPLVRVWMSRLNRLLERYNAHE